MSDCKLDRCDTIPVRGNKIFSFLQIINNRTKRGVNFRQPAIFLKFERKLVQKYLSTKFSANPVICWLGAI